MKCTIPGVNLKVLGRAIQSLSKIGDELYFEPLEEGLFLRSVSSCRSAYACFQFSPDFFINYVDVSGTDEAEDALKCKLGMKSVMTVFRSLSTIDKTVEKCCIALNEKESSLVFRLYRMHGIVKTHNLSYMECERLQPVFSKESCPNKLTSSPKLLCDAVMNFQAAQEEITLFVRPDFIALKNYLEDQTNPAKVMHTELTLTVDEFDSVHVGVETDITFCLKELRAILSFADIIGLPLSIHFESPGRPVTFSISSDLSFEANFVLATLNEDQELPHSSCTKTASTARVQPASKGRPAISKSTSNRQQPTANDRVHQQHLTNEEDEDEDDDLAMAMMDIDEASMIEPGTNRTKQTNRANPEHEELDPAPSGIRSHNKTYFYWNTSHSESPSEQADQNTNRLVTTHSSGQDPSSAKSSSPQLAHREQTSLGTTLPTVASKLSLKSKDLSGSGSDSTAVSPVVPLPRDRQVFNMMTMDDEEDENEDEEDEQILGTPPSKKFRSLFFGTQSSTQPSQQSQSKKVVLALDTDDDDDENSND